MSVFPSVDKAEIWEKAVPEFTSLSNWWLMPTTNPFIPLSYGNGVGNEHFTSICKMICPKNESFWWNMVHPTSCLDQSCCFISFCLYEIDQKGMKIIFLIPTISKLAQNPQRLFLFEFISFYIMLALEAFQRYIWQWFLLSMHMIKTSICT